MYAEATHQHEQSRRTDFGPAWVPVIRHADASRLCVSYLGGAIHPATNQCPCTPWASLP